ncbi:MAG: endolytic transglycosylase MltG [Bdellovibrionales bacterium]
MKKAVVVALLLAMFAGGLIGLWQTIRFLAGGPVPTGQGEERIFEVLPGEGFYRVASRVEQEGLVTSALKFKILAKLSGQADSLRVGEYAVRTDLRPIELLSILSSGKSIERQITFPEGYNIYDIALAVEQKGLGKKEELIRLARDPRIVEKLLGEKLPSLEGYLFPETYKYTKYTSLESLLKSMVERFKERYATLGYGPNEPMTRHQIVTMASVIEKETGAPEERPLISSVFHNRLKRGMRLQSDPTILYGIWSETGEWKQNITREDITRHTPYNTYTVAALPVGPISNPGLEALASVGQPATSEFLFFVSKNDGTHTFSENFAQHNSAVQKFQIDRKAREGKSWRDLNKSEKSTAKRKAAAPVKPAVKK